MTALWQRQTSTCVGSGVDGLSIVEPTMAGMARYVIDAHTLIHLLTANVPVNPKHQLVAPSLIRSQALSLLLAAVRHDGLPEKVALQRHERLTGLKMRLLGDRASRRTAFKIAREQGWETTYEAEYLGVTRLQADAFVTIDPEMAAKAEGVVPTARLDALTGK